VIGSIFVRSGHLLIPSLEKELHAEALPLARKVCRIVPSELEEQLGDIASLSVAANISDINIRKNDPDIEFISAKSE